MNVTYIAHSGFLVELERHLLLFDYVEGTLPALDVEKELFIFVSHKHADHYHKKIFDIVHPNKHYLLSYDIKNYLPVDHLHILNFYEQYQINDLYVETLRSTDIGLAFMIRLEDTSIYFAGDLHWWHWEGEGEQIQMRDNYLKEMTKLWKHFDIAFVVLDPRLKHYYDLGLRSFLEYSKATYLFPMHMWDDYSIINKYLLQYNNQTLIKITDKSQVFKL